MYLTELATVESTYAALQWLDDDHDGQLYGTMEGSLAGRLSGALHLTNFAALRADGVNLPTLRGVLTTADEATVWVELDGLATLREEEGQARVFITTFRFRTGDERYAWLNVTFGSLEGSSSPAVSAASHEAGSTRVTRRSRSSAGVTDATPPRHLTGGDVRPAAG